MNIFAYAIFIVVLIVGYIFQIYGRRKDFEEMNKVKKKPKRLKNKKYRVLHTIYKNIRR